MSNWCEVSLPVIWLSVHEALVNPDQVSFKKVYINIQLCTRCFDNHIHSEMMITVRLINIYISPYIVIIFCVDDKAPKIYSLHQCPAYNIALLIIIIMPYIRSLDLLILHNCNFLLFDQHVVLSDLIQGMVQGRWSFT